MRHILTLPSLLFCCAVAGQTACDSVQVDSIRYAPFGDGLQVALYNGSMQFLSGPTVDVINADGDTIGQGSQEFFGVLQGPSLHQVHFTPQPPTPFSGTVVLNYYDMDGWVSCDLPVSDIDLCPPAGCAPAQVFAYQQGGNPVAMDLDWSVTDADNNAVDGGVLSMDGTGFGYVVSDVCLLPGAYTLHVSQAVPAGTTIQVGMTQANFAYTEGVMMQLPVGGAVELPFDYYILCADAVQGITPQPSNLPSLVVDGRILRISSSKGQALGNMTVLDGMGRTVRTISSNASSTAIDLGNAPAGAYVLHALSPIEHSTSQRFILN